MITPNIDEEASMMEDVGMQDVHFNEVSWNLREFSVIWISLQLLFTHFALTKIILQATETEQQKQLTFFISRNPSFTLERELEELVSSEVSPRAQTHGKRSDILARKFLILSSN